MMLEIYKFAKARKTLFLLIKLAQNCVKLWSVIHPDYLRQCATIYVQHLKSMTVEGSDGVRASFPSAGLTATYYSSRLAAIRVLLLTIFMSNYCPLTR